MSYNKNPFSLTKQHKNCTFVLQFIFLLAILKETKKRQGTRNRVTQNHRSKGFIFYKYNFYDSGVTSLFKVHPVVFSFTN